MLFRKKRRIETPCFGMLATFADSDTLLEAVLKARGQGYTKMEAYTPLPLHDVAEAIGHKNHLPLLVLIGGIVGAVTGFGMQYYSAVRSYPLNIGGRPDNSWPAFIVVTFELTILFAAVTAVLGMLALNGLPRPHHPVFAMPTFELASRDRFFLLLMAHDPRFDRDEAAHFLAETESLEVQEVPN